MSRFFRPEADSPEPEIGSTIQLLNSDGKYYGKVSKVRQVIAEDTDDDIWEIRDSYNQTRYIRPGPEGSWWEIELDA